MQYSTLYVTGDRYFGLGEQEKQQLYGPSRNVSPSTITAKVAVQCATDNVTNQPTPVPNVGVTIEQQRQQKGYESSDHQHISPGNTNKYAITTPTINVAAASVVDDYSFTNVFTNINLSSPGNQCSPGGTSISGHHLSSGNLAKRSNLRNNLMEWYNRSFQNKSDRYQPPNLDYETNLAPRGMNYSSGGGDTNSTSGSNCFAPNGIYVKHDAYHHRRREVMKMGLGVMVMVVMCTIFGVRISELKKANAALPNGGGSGGSQLNGMVPAPSTDFSSTRIDPIAATVTPSASPTKIPDTLQPTKSPLTRSPVSGYYAVHIKTSDGTAWPTKSPVTSRPTNVSCMNEQGTNFHL